LILSGAFSSLFSREMVRFNEISGEFGFRHVLPEMIQVEGEGLALIWTKNALTRLCLRPGILQSMLIRVEEHDGITGWYLRTKQIEKRFLSIYDLCCFISLNVKRKKNG
jgi:hypothetical protein